MNRFYVPKNEITAQSIVIKNPDDIHHLARVLRLRIGAEIFISDGEGSSYVALISSIQRHAVVLEIKRKQTTKQDNDKVIHITLAVAVPKNTRFEDIVDKATQLGIDAIVPLFTKRTITQRNVFEKKRSRFRRIMISAAKQSGALFLPDLKESLAFNDLIKKTIDYDVCLLPNLSHQSLSLKEAIQPFASRKQEKPIKILVLIGPEGDFTKEEISLAFKAGCRGIGLGESILRVDTAAIVVAGFLKLYFSK